MTEPTTTPFSKRCEILGEVWFEFRDSELLQDVIVYGDLAFPLAFAISEKIIDSTPLAENFVNEIWELFTNGIGIETDTGFDSLEELLSASDYTPED